MADLLANIEELSVTGLSGALKRTVEERFGHVRVRGEITGYRGPHSSGHAYFSLKDEGAKIDAVIWKGVFARLKFKPQEGLQVVATGKVTTYAGKSSYQLIIEALEPQGEGALMLVLEERRRRLAAEGLFDTARKRPLPFLPQVIGVITSPTGAVIRDIIHRLGERFARHVLVWPVRVQGETCAAEVAAAIEGFNALPHGGPVPRPDVLIVARGGGSLEDLAGFSEESVVRAAAASQIPLISAVGHETDTTLIDFAADLRAPTPTAAAEKVVPVRLDQLALLRGLDQRRLHGMTRFRQQARVALRALVRAMPDADRMMAERRQRLDRNGERLRAGLKDKASRLRVGLGRLSPRLAGQSPRVRLALAKARVDAIRQRSARAFGEAQMRRRTKIDGLEKSLAKALAARLALERERQLAARRRWLQQAGRLPRAFSERQLVHKRKLQGLAALLNSLDHRNVLGRGFALVRRADGTLVSKIAAAPPGTLLSIEMADGQIAARVEREAGKAGATPAPEAAAKPQGQLF
ncbi:MAG: exodeoxyribonuclease VII large subunit [Hyphomicrobiales bacterium]|nr:exodeoxyribonuclease VII large subunit [Hyphomicrobiales bacterium]